MELFLQFGHGMMEHSRVLLSSWGGGTVVLSPRDLTAEQLGRLGAAIGRVSNAHSLIDPQFYLPHPDHKKLCEHSYWPANYQTSVFWQGPALTQLLQALSNLNQDVGTSRMILPGLFAESIDDDWLEMQRAVLEEARVIEVQRPLIATIALCAEAVQNPDQVSPAARESRKLESPSVLRGLRTSEWAVSGRRSELGRERSRLVGRSSIDGIRSDSRILHPSNARRRRRESK